MKIKYASLWGAAYFLLTLAIAIVFVAILTGCGTIERQTNSDKVSALIIEHLPASTTVNVVSDYEMIKLKGRDVKGFNTRTKLSITESIKTGSLYSYEITTINDPVVLLHEFCHSLEWEFHSGYDHANLRGCKHFSFNTINRVKI